MNGTRFQEKRFTVPAVDKAPTDCQHGWLDKRGKCVLCGEQVIYDLVKIPFRDTLTGDPEAPQFVRDVFPENGGLLIP